MPDTIPGPYQQLRNDSYALIHQYFHDRLLLAGSVLSVTDLQHMELFQFEEGLQRQAYRDLFYQLLGKLRHHRLVTAQYEPSGNQYIVVRAVASPLTIIGERPGKSIGIHPKDAYDANKEVLGNLVKQLAAAIAPAGIIYIAELIQSLQLPYLDNKKVVVLYYNYITAFFRSKARQGYFKKCRGKMAFERTDKAW